MIFSKKGNRSDYPSFFLPIPSHTVPMNTVIKHL